MAELSEAFEKQLYLFENAPDAAKQLEALTGIVAVREEFGSMFNLCYVRHTSNTADPFYEAENQYFDEQSPSFEALNNRFYQALLSSPFREVLAKKFGNPPFHIVRSFAQNIPAQHSRGPETGKCAQHRIHQNQSPRKS
jgi:hypothetical protein